MHSYFISDLHLSEQRPQVSQAFIKFLASDAAAAEQLFILGDLFEYWIGDDAASLVGAEPILQQMSRLAEQVPCHFIAGNRDFLVGEEFCKMSGFSIMPDESVIDLYGTPTLILHGDSLCIEDHEHQLFRQMIVTNEQWRDGFLALSIPERIEAAKQARMESQQHKSSISMEIMDVTESAVLDAFVSNDVRQMIHGHTHRQATHQYKLEGNGQATRHVLGDWSQTASILIADADGIKITNPPI
ncbi:MAG: UDP-2,3-diacylglucosamine diphosphatase [Arenicella sp.]|nr:UDP-2,3-diacylglucosamine diphosphatase [Arenicella sp.]